MPASEARILANQANAQNSTGPRTEVGKERSRQNSYKHGMTGNGVVIPVEDAAEVERRSAAFREELQPTGEVGRALVRRAAFMSVQLDRSMARDDDATAERVRRVEAEFVAPEGLDAAAAERLKAVAKRRATFDPSPEAALARKYEAAAERGLLRALKGLRLIEKQARAAVPMVDDETIEKTLASLFQIEKTLNEREARHKEQAPMPPSKPRSRIEPGYLEKIDNIFDVPIAIGKRR
jgi:hypothetical protein